MRLHRAGRRQEVEKQGPEGPGENQFRPYCFRDLDGNRRGVGEAPPNKRPWRGESGRGEGRIRMGVQREKERVMMVSSVLRGSRLKSTVLGFGIMYRGLGGTGMACGRP